MYVYYIPTISTVLHSMYCVPFFTTLHKNRLGVEAVSTTYYVGARYLQYLGTQRRLPSFGKVRPMNVSPHQRLPQSQIIASAIPRDMTVNRCQWNNCSRSSKSVGRQTCHYMLITLILTHATAPCIRRLASHVTSIRSWHIVSIFFQLSSHPNRS